MKKQTKTWIIVLVIILILSLLAGGLTGYSLGKKSESCSTQTTINNQIEGTCEDGGSYRCYITCTDTPPKNTYKCCSGGITHSTTSCYANSCPSGYSLIDSFNTQTDCNYNCGRNQDQTPTDSSTCRDYSTSQGYSASGWDGSVTSLTGCQAYALGHGCSVPSKIDYIANCCMWSC